MVHRGRVLLEVSGVLRKYRGRFIIGREFRAAIERQGPQGAYPHLFRICAREFNWTYGGYGEELSRIQYFFGYTMYLLALYGDEPLPITFYSDAFLRAFPLLEREVTDTRFGPARERLRDSYEWRTFTGFAEFMGLVTLTGKRLFAREPLVVQATPLFREFVQLPT